MNETCCPMIGVLRLPALALRKLYSWTTHWSKTPQAPVALFGIAFIESSFFPIPPDVLLIAMVMNSPKKWLRYAVICTAGSVVGALLGYLIGWAFFKIIGKPIVDFYHLQNAMDLVRQKYHENAFLTIFTAAFTPIPYKVITIAAGLFHISLSTLVIASIIGRAARFFLVAGLLRVFGERMRVFIEKYFDWLSIIFVILLIGGFIALKSVSSM